MFVVVTITIVLCRVDLEFIDQAQIGPFRVLKKKRESNRKYRRCVSINNQ
jgi:hypothetical protein